MSNGSAMMRRLAGAAWGLVALAGVLAGGATWGQQVVSREVLPLAGRPRVVHFTARDSLLVVFGRERLEAPVVSRHPLSAGGSLRALQMNDDAVVMLSSTIGSPDGQFVSSSLHDNGTRIFRATDGAEMPQVKTGEDFHERRLVAWHPNGRLLATGTGSEMGYRRDGLHVWRIADGEQVARSAEEQSVASVCFSPDGRVLAALGTNMREAGSTEEPRASLSSWEVADDGKLTPMRSTGIGKDTTGCLVFLSAGKVVVAEAERMTIFDARTHRVVGSALRQHPGKPQRIEMAAAPDGKRILVLYLMPPASRDGGPEPTQWQLEWELWDTDRPTVCATGNLRPADFSVPTFSSDSRYFAIDGQDRVWRAADGKEVAQLPGKAVVSGTGSFGEGYQLVVTDDQGQGSLVRLEFRDPAKE